MENQYFENQSYFNKIIITLIKTGYNFKVFGNNGNNGLLDTLILIGNINNGVLFILNKTEKEKGFLTYKKRNGDIFLNKKQGENLKRLDFILKTNQIKFDLDENLIF